MFDEKLVFDEKEGWTSRAGKVALGQWAGLSIHEKRRRVKAIVEAIETVVQPALRRAWDMVEVPGGESVSADFAFFEDIIGAGALCSEQRPSAGRFFREAQDQARDALQRARSQLGIMALALRHELMLLDSVA